jgi:hypothetical protein
MWLKPHHDSDLDQSSSMPKRKPADIASEIRHMLHHGGSPEHAKGVQWFFKEEIKSHGWYTGNLRRAAVQARREILKEHDLKFLLKVADHLFSGRVLEEKVFPVLMLEKLTAEFGDAEFRLFESWLNASAAGPITMHCYIT